MKKLKCTPYNFNAKYEYRTHKYVGRDYGSFKMANRGIITNIIRFARKIWNKKQKKYIVCNTYTEWKTHVINIIRKDMSNYEDFIHWLYYMKRDSEKDLQMVKVIQIPIYIVILSLSTQIFNLERLTIENTIIILVIITGASAKYLLRAYDRVCFYDDVIEIYEAEFGSIGKAK